jgi:hypothetical protein
MRSVIKKAELSFLHDVIQQLKNKCEYFTIVPEFLPQFLVSHNGSP